MNKRANELDAVTTKTGVDAESHGIDCVAEYRPVVERFKLLYNELNASTIASGIIEETYAPDMRFEDCFHVVEGREAFRTHCIGLYENVQSIRFDFHDEFIKPGEAMLSWTMTYVHSKLNRGKPIKVEGASLIRFQDKVSFHKDYFDGGQLLYEQVPLLGGVIQSLKKRVGA